MQISHVELPSFSHVSLRKVAPKGLSYLFAFLILALPTAFQRELSPQAVQPVSAQISTDLESWLAADLTKLLLPSDTAWLRIIFNVPDELAEQAIPLGLYLGGTFSA